MLTLFRGKRSAASVRADGLGAAPHPLQRNPPPGHQDSEHPPHQTIFIYN